MATHPTTRQLGRWAVFAACGLSLVACVKARINVVDQRTSLESQILGSYEELDRDLQMVASVRSVDADGQSKPAPSFHEIRQGAIEARQTQQFNRDDVDELKKAGCLGEGSDGRLQSRTCQEQSDPAIRQRATRLLESENGAREILMDFVVTTSPDLTRADLPQVRAAYARMNREAAERGHWIQQEDGKWVQKP